MRLRHSLSLLATLVASSFAFAGEAVTLTFIHTNDTHARMEPAVASRQEIGGRSRLATAIKEALATSTNPILLDAGDVFQGTLYFNVYEGLADLAIMNHLGYQAMAVGNHEFDRGEGPLATFAKNASFPLLSANIDASGSEALRDWIKPSIVLDVNEGTRIAIIGCTTPDLPTVTNMPDTIKMKPLVPSVQAEIDKHKAAGIDIIVVLSHCGWDIEQQLGRELNGVDLIIGGHSHTLLGDFPTPIPGNPTIRGSYPLVMNKPNGETVLLVQAWEWGKVLGKLSIDFDAEGRITDWSKDSPRVIDASIPNDSFVDGLIAAFKLPIAALAAKEVGTASAEIPRGALMGNVIADAMLDFTRRNGAQIAFMNSGGVRAGWDAGTITFGEAIQVQPFGNTLVTIEMTGAEIKASLEWGARQMPEGSGGLLFPSANFTYVVDPSKPVGERVVEMNLDGKPLDLSATYVVCHNNFIAGGGDGHDVIKNAKGKRYDTGMIDVDATVEFLKKGPVAPATSDRIIIRR